MWGLCDRQGDGDISVAIERLLRPGCWRLVMAVVRSACVVADEVDEGFDLSSFLVARGGPEPCASLFHMCLHWRWPVRQD